MAEQRKPTGAEPWDDDKEAQLIRLLFALLPDTVAADIEATSHATNFRWSNVVDLALTTTDWARLTAVLKEVDDEEAVEQAERLVRPDADDS